MATQRPPKLLSGGNPRVARGDGDGPVRAYLAAMPGWKADVGRLIDSVVTRSVPDVRKGVRWNSPFYGVDGGGWFMSFHCLTRYVKVAFFAGSSLQPLPPETSKDPAVRYVHYREGEKVDEALFASWVAQASRLPGWSGG